MGTAAPSSRVAAAGGRPWQELAHARARGYACGPPAGPSFWSAALSSRRELMPSLVNTSRRRYSTVRALRNSRAPISALVRPSRARAAKDIPAWCGRQLFRPCACARSHRWPPARAGRARRRPPCATRPADRGRLATGRGPPRGADRGAAIRRRWAGPIPAGARRGRAGRPPRGSSSQRRRHDPAAPVSELRARARSRVPPACVVSASRPRARSATRVFPVRTAASISSGNVRIELYR